MILQIAEKFDFGQRTAGAGITGGKMPAGCIIVVTLCKVTEEMPIRPVGVMNCVDGLM